MVEVENKKDTFPLMPTKHWWALRKKFKQSIPGVVTDNYIATVLGMQVNSARNNIMPYLKMVGLIDQDGKPLERAKRWRDDGEYPAVCEEIRKEIYPQDLLDAVPEVTTDRQVVERWFANQTGVGEVAARKMASFYMILVEADPAKAPNPQSITQKNPSPTKQIPKNNQKKPEPPKQAFQESLQETTTVYKNSNSDLPSININIQIHISSDASPEQIDQIFSSMAKHIYKS